MDLFATSLGGDFSKDDSRLFVDCLVNGSVVTALVDSGAAQEFISLDTAKELNLALVPLNVSVKSITGAKIGNVLFKTKPVHVLVGAYYSTVEFMVLEKLHVPVILGINWLKRNNPTIDWSNGVITDNYGSSIGAVKLSAVEIEQTFLETLKQVVPSSYHDLLDIFDTRDSEMPMPPHRPGLDLAIKLQPGTHPPRVPIIRLSRQEEDALEIYLEKMLKLGYIVPSKSPYGAPVFFVKAAGKEPRPVIDYRGLNAITVKDGYSLPLQDEVLDRLSKAKFFTKLDLKSAFNLLRIAPGDESLTAFRCFKGTYEYLVMPFGLSNAPSAFQRLVNHIFADLIYKDIMIYIDDIVIFGGETLEEHIKIVRKVLERCKENYLKLGYKKCQFHTSSIELLGFVVTTNGIKPSPAKIKSVVEWPIPSSILDVQSFLGFANFLRRFVPRYSQVAKPLNNLVTAGTFSWPSECQSVFQEIKDTLASAPVLVHANHELPFVIECDASDFALGSVLLQEINGRLHPVAYHSRSFTPTEQKQDTFYKEMLAILDSFKVWRHHLLGAKHEVQVFTDHKNLTYLKDAVVVKPAHARWQLFMSQFNYKITHKSGASNHRADALSRRADYLFNKVPLEPTPIFDPDVFLDALEPTNVDLFVSLSLEDLPRLTQEDEFVQRVRAYLENNHLNKPHPNVQEFRYDDYRHLLYWKERIYVPEPLRTYVTALRHDFRLGGHLGDTKTVELVLRDYWWPGLRRFVRTYVTSCSTCQQTKVPRHKPDGLLQPLPTPTIPWSYISMDFITDLPESEGCTVIMVVVDLLTKMSHFIGFPKMPTSKNMADVFLRRIVKFHGFPEVIVSDRGSQFVSHFWTEICKALGITKAISTAYHPETDGQTERVNQVLEIYLRSYVDYRGKDWASWLWSAEFVYNNSIHSSTKHTPFFANYGYHPRFDLTVPRPLDAPESRNYLQDLALLHRQLVFNLEHAKSLYKKHADTHRQAPPAYQVGDRVYLRTTNLMINRPRKFKEAYAGPFTVTHVTRTGTAVTLALHDTWIKDYNIHPTFHVSLIKPARDPRGPDGIFKNRPRPVVKMFTDGDDTLVVYHSIVNSRFLDPANRLSLQYQVQLRADDDTSLLWLPADDLQDPVDVNRFHAANPGKPPFEKESRTSR